MVRQILTHELRQQLRNKVFWLLLPLTIAIAILIAVTHWQQQQSFLQSQQQWQVENEELWQSQPDRHPHRVAHYGSMVFKPISPLSFIDAGVNPFVGNALFLEAHRQNGASIKQFQFAASNLALGYPSLATLILALWPLVLIALAYGSFSAEREQGTLKIALALGVRWRTLFFGKALAYGLVSIGLLALLFGGVAVLLVGTAGAAASTDMWQRFVGLFALYSLYCAVWVIAVVSVSAVSRTNQQSLWALVCAWLLLIVLIPRVIPTIVEAAHPTPNRAAFDVGLAATLEQLGDSHDPNDPHFAQFRDKVLREHQVDTIEQLPINWLGLLMAEGERLTSVAFQTHYEELHRQFAHQDALRNRLVWLSPYSLATILSSRFAGTDAAEVYEFERQAEAFRYDMIQKLNHHHTYDIAYENDRQQKLNRQSWLDFSGFQFKPLSLEGRFRESGVLYLTLIIWLLVLTYFGTRGELKRIVL